METAYLEKCKITLWERSKLTLAKVPKQHTDVLRTSEMVR